MTSCMIWRYIAAFSGHPSLVPLDGAGIVVHVIATMLNVIDTVVKAFKTHCVHVMILTASIMIWRHIKYQ